MAGNLVQSVTSVAAAPATGGVSPAGYVNVGGPVSFTNADFEDTSTVARLAVTIDWAKIGNDQNLSPTGFTQATCQSNPALSVRNTEGTALQQETLFYLVHVLPNGGVAFRNLSRYNDFTGILPMKSYLSATWTDTTTEHPASRPSYGAPTDYLPPVVPVPATPYFEPGEQLGANPMVQSFGNQTPMGTWQLMAAVAGQGTSPICIRGWSIDITVEEPLAKVAIPAGPHLEGDIIPVDMSGTLDDDNNVITLFEYTCNQTNDNFPLNDGIINNGYVPAWPGSNPNGTCSYDDEGTYTFGMHAVDTGITLGTGGPFEDFATQSIDVLNAPPEWTDFTGIGAPPVSHFARPHQWYESYHTIRDPGVNDNVTFVVNDNIPYEDVAMFDWEQMPTNFFGIPGAHFQTYTEWYPSCADIPNSSTVNYSSEYYSYTITGIDNDNATVGNGVSNDNVVQILLGDFNDGDSDGASNCYDNCPSLPNSNQLDYDDDDYNYDDPLPHTGGDVCDDDDDNDNVVDLVDTCAHGHLGWTSTPTAAGTDYDHDGCEDDNVITEEDLDDDNDNVNDTIDRCDPDTTDTVLDPGALTNQLDSVSIQKPYADYDGDGCHDGFSEETDQDNDTVLDVNDACIHSVNHSFVSDNTLGGNDHDGDGCEDSLEDPDDDNDNVLDGTDKCDPDSGHPDSTLGWSALVAGSDYDGDGCQDAAGNNYLTQGEDPDDDNDNRPDSTDNCDPNSDEGAGVSIRNWDSLVGSLDHDSDGCKDVGLNGNAQVEDGDDDNDGLADGSDICALGDIGSSPVVANTVWVRTTATATPTDYDADGCRDATEDPDDDNDNRMDGADNCDPDNGGGADHGVQFNVSTGPSFISFGPGYTGDDYDQDGCQDTAAEDDNDDNDNVLDAADLCDPDNTGAPDHGAQNSVTGPSTFDYDGDGCNDQFGEETDQDNDGVPDSVDLCDHSVNGVFGTGSFVSTPANDHDGDGCQDDSLEDNDDDNDNRLDDSDDCDPDSASAPDNGPAADHGVTDSATYWDSNDNTVDYDGDGCEDHLNDNVLQQGEDLDDDNDKRDDSQDQCDPDSFQNSTRHWDSLVNANDHDQDGCYDLSSEDNDDDNDGIDDFDDRCDPDFFGPGDHGNDNSVINVESSDSGGFANVGTDYDYDGCNDNLVNDDGVLEDTDDDNDNRLDGADTCDPDNGMRSNLGPIWGPGSVLTGKDYDNDGCEDGNPNSQNNPNEDTDDDNDNVIDSIDRCDPDAQILMQDPPDPDQGIMASVIDWDSLPVSPGTQHDHDHDGCFDLNSEDNDDDNDRVQDGADTCPVGNIAWVGPDYDSDGCDDTDTTYSNDNVVDNEETDDDNDGVPNSSDLCLQGVLTAPTRFLSSSLTDNDHDGCRDDAFAGTVLYPQEDFNDDNDTVLDVTDNCRLVPNDDQLDSDLDGAGNVCDNDDDNDGVLDPSDNCPLVAGAQTNTDGDSLGDVCDPDDDNDGVLDGADTCPLLTGAQTDTDLDGQGNICDADDDNDGVTDGQDNCPLSVGLSASQIDSDFDGLGNVCDPDDDNDGTADASDNCPLTPGAQTDTDGDTIGDVCDPDDDNDGAADASDNCPLSVGQSASQLDSDFDGLGNVCDPDDDNDGTADASDNCPLVAGAQTNTDGDAAGDVCDTDDDNDGVADALDNCPVSFGLSSSQLDTDFDGAGNVCDGDDDGDGVADASDNCPVSFGLSSSQLDTDGDLAGNVCDTDDDGDGTDDAQDNCPLIANLDQANSDNDPNGNACDTDDDNDGVLDTAPDNCQFVANPGQADQDHNGVGDACDGNTDGDPYPNVTDNCPLVFNDPQTDTDHDGIGDVCDDDKDGDTLKDNVDNCDLVANLTQDDMDHDGIGDVCDLDVDGDGVLGSDELAYGTNDNVVDSDGDTIADGTEYNGGSAYPADTDNDNIIDALDADSDNDNITDLNEAGDLDVGTEPVDTDDDGTYDFRDLESDGDGFNDIVDNCPHVANANQLDSDHDGVGDVCDFDTDGDGLTDEFEDQYGLDPDSTDSDNDTIPDAVEVLPLTQPAGAPHDTDGDGTPDAIDTDSDNDGNTDLSEAGSPQGNPFPQDSDADQVPDYRDNDSDNDGTPDLIDNCDLIAGSQADFDGDGLGDVCDPNDDNDTYLDVADKCPLLASANNNDNDNDTFGDPCDLDDDNDGALDTQDNCPMSVGLSSSQLDNDADGQGNVCDADDDNDGFLDALPDNCQFLAQTDQLNTDGDAFGDACDSDDDNDGTPDTIDNCPLASGSQLDSDFDGLGNACDDNDDNDNVLDVSDNCALVANDDQANNDQDSLGDACDSDDDNDGIADTLDNCQFVAGSLLDTDHDGLGDVCDPNIDNDNFVNAADNCPLIANDDQANLDQDGLGDVCDPDDDGDNVNDVSDNCPLIANTSQTNTDLSNDGGDACDPDDDNDGIADASDNCSTMSNLDQANNDGDDFGDVCDADDDNDEIPDTTDNCHFVANNNQLNTDGDDDGGNACDDDDDNDGVPDATDNCALVQNADQKNTDRANDGGDACDDDDDDDTVLDTKDNCPRVSNATQLDTDKDKSGNACDDDDDDDSVLDGADNCSIVANGNQADTNSDGLGDACQNDDDGDGIKDSEDNCPVNANPDQTDKNQNGVGAACDPNDATGGNTGDDAGVETDGGTGDSGIPGQLGDAGVACDLDSILAAMGVTKPATLDRDSIIAALKDEGIEVPEDASSVDFNAVVRGQGVLLPTGCDVEALFQDAVADSGCSCRTVGAGTDGRATGGLLFIGLGLVLAYRRRRRTN